MLLEVLNNPAPKAAPITNSITLLKDWVTPLLIAGIVIFVGIVVQRIVIIYIKRLAKRTHWKGATVLATALRGMIVLLSVLFGVYYGMTFAPLNEQTLNVAHKLHIIFIIFIITFVIARVLTGLLKTYSHREQSSKGSLSLFKSIINIIVYCLGLLVILQSIGISITPILTALGVGGLAVALALQDTLSNLFAGIQITLTRTIKPGDFIHLSSGEEGTVVDITWRSTTLLTRADNMIVIPNSKLATTIITNYSLPQIDFSFSVSVGVGYESDLDKVENISMEVAMAVLKEAGVDKIPIFRYTDFGNSSINFTMYMGVNEFGQQFVLRHKFIKSLNKRYNAEGINIPFPITTVYMKKEGE